MYSWCVACLARAAAIRAFIFDEALSDDGYARLAALQVIAVGTALFPSSRSVVGQPNLTLNNTAAVLFGELAGFLVIRTMRRAFLCARADDVSCLLPAASTDSSLSAPHTGSGGRSTFSQLNRLALLRLATERTVCWWVLNRTTDLNDPSLVFEAVRNFDFGPTTDGTDAIHAATLNLKEACRQSELAPVRHAADRLFAALNESIQAESIEADVQRREDNKDEPSADELIGLEQAFQDRQFRGGLKLMYRLCIRFTLLIALVVAFNLSGFSRRNWAISGLTCLLVTIAASRSAQDSNTEHASVYLRTSQDVRTFASH